MLLYNIPPLSGAPITAELLRRLSKYDRLYGMKDSFSKTEPMLAFIHEFSRLKILTGVTQNVLANTTPPAFVTLWGVFGTGAGMFTTSGVGCGCAEPAPWEWRGGLCSERCSEPSRGCGGSCSGRSCLYGVSCSGP